MVDQQTPDVMGTAATPFVMQMVNEPKKKDDPKPREIERGGRSTRKEYWATLDYLPIGFKPGLLNINSSFIFGDLQKVKVPTAGGGTQDLIAIPIAARNAAARKKQFIDRLNMLYAREDARSGTALGGAQAGAGNSRDGISSLLSVIVENGLYSDASYQIIDQQLAQFDAEIQASITGNVRRRSTGILGLLGAAGGGSLGLFLGGLAAVFGGPLGWIALGCTLLGGAIGALTGNAMGRREERARNEQINAIIPSLDAGPPPAGFARSQDVLPQTAQEELDMNIEHANRLGGLGKNARHMASQAAAQVGAANDKANYTVNNPQVDYRRSGPTTLSRP